MPGTRRGGGGGWMDSWHTAPVCPSCRSTRRAQPLLHCVGASPEQAKASLTLSGISTMPTAAATWQCALPISTERFARVHFALPKASGGG